MAAKPDTSKNNPSSIPTSDFLRQLVKTSDLESFIERHGDEMDPPEFHVFISELCSASGQVPEHVILRADIERTYGHQLFNGTRNPSRDKVIQLAFGLGLDVDAAQKLLLVAQFSPLYPKLKRDAAILYCLEHELDIMEVQSLLQSLGLTLLGKRPKKK
ncbi:MAG: hypothetical protein PWQ55_2413 [Chloroflexota bacterium]|nr:hypothetical protein [Chloroflexota bacterium]